MLNTVHFPVFVREPAASAHITVCGNVYTEVQFNLPSQLSRPDKQYHHAIFAFGVKEGGSSCVRH